MFRRAASPCLLLLCALAFSASQAPSALAATSGTTAYTCVPGGGLDNFGDAHCDTTKASGGFGHVSIVGKTGDVEGTNAATASETKAATTAVLRTTLIGVEAEIVCAFVSSTGTLENKLEGEVHKILGSETVLTYKGCTVPKPAGRECQVHSSGAEKGTIKTNPMKSESIELEGKMFQKFSPATGEEVATLVLEACKSGLNKSYVVTGTVNAAHSGTDSPNSAGATLVTNLPKVASSPLKVDGWPAGLTQVETIKMKGGNPIGATAPPFQNLESGTTAVACVKGAATNDFGDAHCDTTKAGGGFGHVAIEGKATGVEGTNSATASETGESTSAVLTTTFGGIAGEIVCANVSATGTLENKLTVEGHKVLGSETVITYSGCLALHPLGEECKVIEDVEGTKTEGTEGQIKTAPLKSESVELGGKFFQRFAPSTGTALGSFYLKGCKKLGFNKTYEVSGVIDAESDGDMIVEGKSAGVGATLKVNIPKGQFSVLRVAGQGAGLTQATTVRMNGGNPVGATGAPFK